MPCRPDLVVFERAGVTTGSAMMGDVMRRNGLVELEPALCSPRFTCANTRRKDAEHIRQGGNVTRSTAAKNGRECKSRKTRQRVQDE